MNLFLIYFEFCKIGLFAVGGGLATLPFLFQMADKYDWLNREMLGNFLAIAQSSPGAIGVNASAQVGFQYSGIPGALLAALGLVSPAIAVICAAARILQTVKDSKIATSVFMGLRPAAAGLLAAAGFGVWKLTLYNNDGGTWYEFLRWKETALFTALFLLVWKLRAHPVVYIAFGAVAGIMLGI